MQLVKIRKIDMYFFLKHINYITKESTVKNGHFWVSLGFILWCDIWDYQLCVMCYKKLSCLFILFFTFSVFVFIFLFTDHSTIGGLGLLLMAGQHTFPPRENHTVPMPVLERRMTSPDLTSSNSALLQLAEVDYNQIWLQPLSFF